MYGRIQQEPTSATYVPAFRCRNSKLSNQTHSWSPGEAKIHMAHLLLVIGQNPDGNHVTHQIDIDFRDASRIRSEWLFGNHFCHHIKYLWTNIPEYPFLAEFNLLDTGQGDFCFTASWKVSEVLYKTQLMLYSRDINGSRNSEWYWTWPIPHHILEAQWTMNEEWAKCPPQGHYRLIHLFILIENKTVNICSITTHVVVTLI